jgi:hypothetical protein
MSASMLKVLSTAIEFAVWYSVVLLWHNSIAEDSVELYLQCVETRDGARQKRPNACNRYSVPKSPYENAKREWV